MSLINCPECGHEVSTTAVECPNCGRPLHHVAHTAMPPETVITAVPRDRDRFPAWAFIPLGILGVLLLLTVFLLIKRNNDEEANGVNVNITAKRIAPIDNRPGHSGSQTTSAPADSQMVAA